MKKLIIIFSLFCVLLFSYQAESVIIGGLNYVNENRTYYFDNTFPLLQIDYPTGSTTTKTGISLTTTINDTNVTSCQYWIKLGAAFTTNPTDYDCVSTTFNVPSIGDFIAFINVTDGVRVNESNSSFSVTNTGSGGGGGGGGDTYISGNASVIIDFGTSVLTFTVIAPPSTSTKNLLVKNIGNADLKNAKITQTDSLNDYITAEFCDVDKLRCGQGVNLEAGESGWLIVYGEFPVNFVSVDGFIRIEGEKVYELKVGVDKLPLSSIIDPTVNFFMNTGMNKSFAIILTFVMFSGLLFLVFTGLRKGGIF